MSEDRYHHRYRSAWLHFDNAISEIEELTGSDKALQAILKDLAAYFGDELTENAMRKFLDEVESGGG